MRTRLQISLRLLILLIVGVAVCLTMIRWNDSAVRYRRTGNADALYSTLKNQLRNGDSADKVIMLLGSGAIITNPKLIADYLGYARRNPSEHPQGGQDADKFIAYRAGAWNIVLQIRDGRLINFNPADYPLKTGDVISR